MKQKLRRLLLWLSALALVTGGATIASPAYASAPIILSGSSWFGGTGVNVCSNANGGGTDPVCGTETHVGGSVAYGYWQCVELAQRFYQAKGWHSGIFSGVNYAYQIYNNASSLGMSRQANGGITSIAPGDMIIHASTDPGSGGAGHVAIVDSLSGSTINVVEQNGPTSNGRASYSLSGGTLTRGNATILGVVHDPHNPNTSTTGTPTADTDGDGTSDATDLLPTIPGATNNRGVPVGSSNLSGDFNGDSIQDIAVFYDYGGGSLKLWLFLGTGGGNFGNPQMKWDSGAGNWWGTALKPVAGDFNGDGITDIGAFYDFGSRTQLWTFTATTSGINAPVMQWDSGVNGWWWASIQQVVGDFNGDGKADIAAFYDYTGGSTKLWVFTSAGTGFNNPVMKWDSGAGNWGWQAAKPVVGDFNGDGLTDIASFYDYVGGQTKIWLFPAIGSANFGTPQMVWDSGPGNWWWSRLVPFAGDFNGDGKQDISVFYDYTAGSMKSWRFLGTGSGGFSAPTMVWDSGPGNWWLNNVKPVVGDFDSDSKTDIGAFYNYGTRTALWSFTSTSTNLASPIMKWDSGPGNWTWKQVLIP